MKNKEKGDVQKAKYKKRSKPTRKEFIECKKKSCGKFFYKEQTYKNHLKTH